MQGSAPLGTRPGVRGAQPCRSQCHDDQAENILFVYLLRSVRPGAARAFDLALEGFDGRLACPRFYDLRSPELDSDGVFHHPDRDRHSGVAATVGGTGADRPVTRQPAKLGLTCG